MVFPRETERGEEGRGERAREGREGRAETKWEMKLRKKMKKALEIDILPLSQLRITRKERQEYEMRNENEY